MIQCPRCKIQVTELHPLDSETASKLSATGEIIEGPVCMGCISDIRKSLSQSSGGILMAQERAKENFRLELWKNRVALVKKARTLMGGKRYADAAITYEKYLKILEIVFNIKKGEVLNPSHFKDSARTSELTVVTSVYWDLLRIYDTHEKYSERQQNAAKQLATFVQYSPIYPDIIKKAEAFSRNAKNSAAIKSFLKLASRQSAKCFIATSSFKSSDDENVVYLRLFRDYFLNRYRGGRVFVKFYYFISPRIAKIIDDRPWLAAITKYFLLKVIRCIRFIY